MAKHPPSQQPTKDAIDSSIDLSSAVNTEAPKTINPQALMKAPIKAPNQHQHSSPKTSTSPASSLAAYSLSRPVQYPRTKHEEEPLSPRSRPTRIATAASIQDPKPLNLPPAATPPQVHNTTEEILADRNAPETLAVVDRILPFWRVLRKDELYGHQWKGPDERRGGFSGGSGEGGDHEVLEDFGGRGEERTEEEDGRTAGEGEGERGSRKRSHDGSLDVESDSRAKRRELGPEK